MINLILVYPPHKASNDGLHGQDRDWFPIGIASLAAYIETKIKDIKITCLDLFDLNEDEAKSKIFNLLSEEDINYIGFTLMTEQRHQALDLIDELKSYYVTDQYNIKTFVGGPHASIMYQQLSEYEEIDHIIVGEGEKGLEYLLTNPKAEKIIKQGELPIEEIPLAVNGLKYFDEVKLGDQAPIIFSRGCTDRCFFCSTYKTWKKYRTRTPEDVFREMRLFESLYNITDFKFHDDSATANKENLLPLCRLLNSFEPKFTFEMTARADQLDEELIYNLKQAGLIKIALGIESGSEKLRNAMNKKLDIEKAKENIALLKKHKIKVHLLFIVGYPGETKETIEETRQFIIETNPDAFSNLPGLMIIPGTPIYNKLVRDGWIDDTYWLSRKPAPYYTGEHSMDTLRAFNNRLRIIKPLKIMIAGVVNQKPEIFKAYLEGINNLETGSHIVTSKYFILHNSDNLKEFLNEGEYETVNNHLTHDMSHTWTYEKFKFMADQKNKLIQIAYKAEADYIFWIDSDLIVQPPTLEHLIDRGAPIVGEIFWTIWPGNKENKELPNCWDADHYSFASDPEELRKPGLYDVGGTGACILVHMSAYKFANYSPIPNVTFSAWEDRAFCIRAACASIPIYIDTVYPAEHLYTDELYNKWYNKNKGGGVKVE
jgi:radical SAM superfamily enzyme YgiQ (UPF0313 family)/predicted nucleic acid-binding protein